MPRARNAERDSSDALRGEVLTSVDLDLDPQRLHGERSALEAIDQPDAVRTRLPGRLTQPRAECRPHLIEQRPDGARRDLNKVEILGVPARGVDVELVQRGASAKRERLAESRAGEELADRARGRDPAPLVRRAARERSPATQ